MAGNLIKVSTIFLVLFIVLFPFSRYSYGPGIARGQVVFETETLEVRLASCFYSVTGKQTLTWGQGFVPCWDNIHNKEVLWGHVLLQLFAVLSIACIGLVLGEHREDQGRSAEGTGSRSDAAPLPV